MFVQSLVYKWLVLVLSALHRCMDAALFTMLDVRFEQMLLPVQGQALVKQKGQRPAEDAVCTSHPVPRAGSSNAAPVTGISCSLIDELPTMALPMPDTMTGPAWDGFDQEFLDSLV